MMRTLPNRASLVIRSLMRNLHVTDHLVLPDGEKPISAKTVLNELEAEPDHSAPADTGDRVASLAGRYGNFTVGKLLDMAKSDNTGTLDEFVRDVRSMAASLRRQNEHG